VQPGQQPGQTSGEDILRAPMPAQVRALQAAEGDWLEKGQTLAILEAMKMEIRIQAPHAGRLIRLLVSEGQSVDRNQVLAEIRQEVP
jgi:biotin carboxyl carrier protein